MWKNVFIEALLLSVIIFGGFYINATLITKEIGVKQANIRSEQNAAITKLHFSGYWFEPNARSRLDNLSGNTTSSESRSSFSGSPLSSPKVSGNKA